MLKIKLIKMTNFKIKKLVCIAQLRARELMIDKLNILYKISL